MRKTYLLAGMVIGLAALSAISIQGCRDKAAKQDRPGSNGSGSGGSAGPGESRAAGGSQGSGSRSDAGVGGAAGGFVFREKLSEYGFFVDKLSDLHPRAGILPYELVTPLFTDYAVKDRFIVLPA